MGRGLLEQENVAVVRWRTERQSLALEGERRVGESDCPSQYDDTQGWWQGTHRAIKDGLPTSPIEEDVGCTDV
jgi:hypothetical protein